MRKQAILHAGQEYHRKLQTLGRVQGHHLHAIGIGVGLSLAGFEHGVREEGFQWLHVGFALRRKTSRGAHQFEQVLDPSLAAFALLLLVVLDQPLC